MEPFITHTGIVAPLDRANVDTDAIIPKQFLRKIDRTGFGVHLFHELRYTDYEGTKENPSFILNNDPYRQATILLTRDNFGCGSSREHAPWAIADYGFRVIIAPSFADIFKNNCVKNGILTIVLETAKIDELFKLTKENKGIKFSADLENQKLIAEDKEYNFDIHPFAKECLIKGLDHIGWTSQFEEKITTYENSQKNITPWLN